MARGRLHLWCLLPIAIACHQQSPEMMLRDQNHAALLKEAREEYDLVDKKAAMDVQSVPTKHGKPDKKLEITSWTMRRKDGLPAERHHWVGAFDANRRYDGLGLGKHKNYVFVLATGEDAHRIIVVPEDMKIPPHYLLYDPKADLTGGKSGPPLAVREVRRLDGFVFGGCVEGPCSTGHCGTTDAGDIYTGQ